jgi:hypothetical protein
LTVVAVYADTAGHHVWAVSGESAHHFKSTLEMDTLSSPQRYAWVAVSDRTFGMQIAAVKQAKTYVDRSFGGSRACAAWIPPKGQAPQQGAQEAAPNAPMTLLQLYGQQASSFAARRRRERGAFVFDRQEVRLYLQVNAELLTTGLPKSNYGFPECHVELGQLLFVTREIEYGGLDWRWWRIWQQRCLIDERVTNEIMVMHGKRYSAGTTERLNQSDSKPELDRIMVERITKKVAGGYKLLCGMVLQ